MTTVLPTFPKKTYVYVDGFNLYYRALSKWDSGSNCKKTGLRWLDLEKLCKTYLTTHDIVKIKYFTAPVSGRHEIDKPLHQQAYLRALKTLPIIETIYGKYNHKELKIKITRDVKLLWEVPEEKRTDVNIGINLINDGHLKLYDTAIVVSNDSDLAGVLKMAKEELRLSVGLLNPDENFNNELLKYADPTELYKIREGAVKASQLAPTLTDVSGTITKPAHW